MSSSNKELPPIEYFPSLGAYSTQTDQSFQSKSISYSSLIRSTIPVFIRSLIPVAVDQKSEHSDVAAI